MTIEQLARIVHEANRICSDVGGSMDQREWSEAEDWQKQSAIDQVRAHLDNLNCSPNWSHEHWMKQKIADGWIYGPVKDGVLKTHPDLIPYEKLNTVSQGKDYLFSGIVNALSKFVE